MGEWEDFAAFGDFAELEHVCYLLEEAVDELSDRHTDGATCLTGEQSRLLQRLGMQDRQSRQLIEAARPGLYARTWISHLFSRLYFNLDAVTEKPRRLVEELPSIVLDLHKVMIAAHEVFDQKHREALVAAALNAGKEQGASEAKQARSAQAREAVKQRDDQKDRAAFVAWLTPLVEAGSSARNVAEMKRWDGYSGGSWCDYPDDTIKGWAKAAGHPEFKTGRPKKNTGEHAK